MSKLLENLNSQQKAAVEYNEGPLAIIAGAGSGKTRTITHKIAYLIQEKKIKPWRILAVTFTNKASDEMKERVTSLVGEGGEKVWVSTYHSLCARILREEFEAVGLPRNFSILDNIDQKQILTPGYKKFGLSPKGISYGSVIDFISKNKNSKSSPDELRKEAKKETDKAFIDLYEFYLEQTSLARSLDFDDLLIKVNELFKKDKKVLEKWAAKFDHVLVDEFQDTSIIQYEIIMALTPHKMITVVGDPDQTIYTWRYADSNLLSNFKNAHKKVKTVILDQNYRSTPQILDAANLMIKNNKHRIAKNLFTTNDKGDIIEYFHGFSEEAEARWVVQKIDELKKQKNQLKSIAILFRANYLSQSLEKALIESNINYVIFGGVRFYQRQEIKDAISYLKIINNNDEVSFKRMINVPSRKIGATALENLEEFQEKKGGLLFDVVTKNFSKLPLAKVALEELAQFINLINKYKAALKSNSISLVLQKFLVEVKYMDLWSSPEEASRIENLKELINSIKTWEANNIGKGLDEFINEISLYVDKDENPHGSDYVSLMTVHTSKGLEYDNVFIFGFSENVFPSPRSLDEDEENGLEEERRLAYVAVTRAKKRLFISSSKGYAIDYKSQKKPSRFVKELGIDIRMFTKEFIAPSNLDENYTKNRSLITGDKVMHEKFGIGVVVNVAGELAEISFRAPYGVKTLMKNHKSLEKVGN